MKLYSQSLELKTIKRICKGDDNGSYLLGKTKIEHFHTRAGNQAFSRINALLTKDGIPTWDILCEDPVIGQEERKQLRKVKKSLPDKAIDASIKTLGKYLASRKLLQVAEKIVTELNEDSLDVDHVMNNVADDLIKIRTGSSKAKIHYFGGKKNNTKKLVQEVLSKDGVDGIPTGFKTWDDVNGVIPREAVMLIGSSTGGGKSAMAGSICRNLAEMGFFPALSSFEMSVEQLMARLLASLSKVSLERITQGRKKIAKNEAKKIVKKYNKWVKLCKRVGGSHMIYEPESTPTMLQLLYALKPYNPDIIIVDYIALLDDVDGDEDWKKMSEAVRSAKRFAKSNKIPVVILAQIGNDMQLRYSKRMLDDADIAWFWLGDVEAKESGIIHIEHKKARNINPFPFSLKIEWEHAYIRDLTSKELGKSKDSDKGKKMKIVKGKSKLKELD